MQPERAKHFNRNPPSSYHKSLHRNNGSFFGLFLIVRRFPFKRTRLVHVSHVFLFQPPALICLSGGGAALSSLSAASTTRGEFHGACHEAALDLFQQSCT